MNKLILGRYFPGNSLIHHLDPRAKLVAAIAFILIAFLAGNVPGLVLLWLFTFLAMALSGVGFRIYLRGVRPLIWLILFTVLLQILFISGGRTYVEWGPFTVSSFGIETAVFIFSRFVTIIFFTTVVTLTTRPVDLTDGLTFLMRPLRLFHVPVDELSMMVSIALRFIPNLLDETQKIMDAQRARGAVFGEGSLFHQMKVLVPIFLPLFASSLNRGEELANVMDVRGYRAEARRSSFRQLHWRGRDTISMLALLALAAGLAALNLLA
ncbi:energy-coupling factor transporter transmembrane component T family protein [Sporolactobacillus vineae]|uniref:energy-coupling factor transporter transmembrane component T family protein n=1 Tax=Sporolactobacillus vineae TaxID=444463 RepID=UPI000289C800|nr:energy-coupling factor transporter transmembrane component T [Sporolactobacillus vineae]